eukprot:Gb_23036 [translate_table: standard]
MQDEDIATGDDGGGDDCSSYYCEDFNWEDLRDEIEKAFVNHSQCSPHPNQLANEEECRSNKDAWQSFHTRHCKGTFFKERRYLLKEFPELLNVDSTTKVLEVGCGNGSSILPILRANGSLVVYACDCSMVALERAQEMVDAATGVSGACRFNPFYCDFSLESFPSWLCCISCRESFQAQAKHNQEGNDHHNAGVLVVEGHAFGADGEANIKETDDERHRQCCIGGVDIAMLVFTLSSIPLKRMPHVIKECFSVLEPGGMLFFRDYGLYDMTMLRFPHTQKIGDRQYIRGDGTLSYYFSLDILRELFTSAGFVEIEIKFCCVQLLNRRKGQKMRRVWVHGKFQKPLMSGKVSQQDSASHGVIKPCSCS